MRNSRIILAVVAALAIGLTAGYLYRRWKNPTLEEQAQDAAKDLRRGVEKMIK